MSQITKAKKEIQVTIDADQTTILTLPDKQNTVVAIDPKGVVTLYTYQPVKPTQADKDADAGSMLSFLDNLKGASVYGATVEAVGKVIAAVTTGDIRIRPPSAAPGYVKPLEIGDLIGGALYAGDSPETGKKMLVELADEDSPLSFRRALRRARKKSRQTGQNLRLPSAGEATEIFNNLAKAGLSDFQEAAYWTFSPSEHSRIKSLNFKDGLQVEDSKRKKHYVRLMRD